MASSLLFERSSLVRVFFGCTPAHQRREAATLANCQPRRSDEEREIERWSAPFSQIKFAISVRCSATAFTSGVMPFSSLRRIMISAPASIRKRAVSMWLWKKVPIKGVMPSFLSRTSIPALASINSCRHTHTHTGQSLLPHRTTTEQTTYTAVLGTASDSSTVERQ